METRKYWLNLFSAKTWDEFLGHGGTVTGFPEGRWKRLQRVEIGDYFLCYLTGVSRWIGILEVTSEIYHDTSPIWEDKTFPCRFEVKPVVTLTPETAVPIHLLSDRLSYFQNLKNPNAWSGFFRGSGNQIEPDDAEVVIEALRQAADSPVERPVDKSKLGPRPAAIETDDGSVTVPEAEQTEQPSDHTEIQWLLLRLGNDMGLDIWVASNDKGKRYQGKSFKDLPRLRHELPLQFDQATNRTIELIDVLWLSGNSIRAAFEIESSTAIYSGLLRMADLVSMQPDLNIPLYIVAPDERREKVLQEVNRPAFNQGRRTPLNQIVRYIPFSSLRESVEKYRAISHHLQPGFIEEVAEPCDLEES